MGKTKSKTKPGIFITFEGPEGSGKTTNSSKLIRLIRSSGRKVVATREPGGTPFGDRIRTILLSHQNDENIDSLTELLLYEAIRAHHVENVIKPALAEGAVVVCDRYTDASLAYQGYGRKIPTKLVSNLNSVASRNVVPDLTILLDVNPEVGLSLARRDERAESPAGELDRIESAGKAFHQRVRRGYKEIALKNKKRFIVIKRQKDKDSTFALVKAGVLEKFPAIFDNTN
ncbi:MAG: dTMP kinase [Candidatus Lindowbacteria bacterium]|nr:dTMP kinase [Candidatus Lindowbacteria bacterium]